MTKPSNKKDNPMTMISLRLPADMVTELKKLAPLLEKSGYQPLIRTYIEQGIARDQEKIDAPKPVDYLEDQEKAKRTNRTVSETRAEYTIKKPPEFVVGAPLEWDVAVNEETDEISWGKNVVALLNSFSETGWEDIDDPVEWVNEARRKRREAREKPL